MWALRLLPSRSTFHFSLFTFHFPQERFSLPAGTTFHFALCTFHFPKGLLFTSRRDRFSLPAETAVRRPMQHAPMAGAARCVGTCTALRFPGEHSPFLYKAASVGKHSIPPQPFHPVAGPGKARPQVQLCALHFPAAYSPCPASAPLRKEQKRFCHTRKQAVRTSPGTSAPPGAIV